MTSQSAALLILKSRRKFREHRPSHTFDRNIRRKDPHLFTIAAGSRAIVNVGSVGQPRDRDPRACCAIYDTETRTMQLKRYRYDIEAVVSKVRSAGLPVELGARLRLGR